MKMGVANTLAVYAITAGFFFLIDLFWLGVLAKGFYAKHLGHLLREQVNWPAALVFYMVYIAGIQLFVVGPALQGGWGVGHTAIWGGLLGLFAYCTFELTALALIKSWPLPVAVVDIAWGTLLTAATAAAVMILARLLIKSLGTA